MKKQKQFNKSGSRRQTYLFDRILREKRSRSRGATRIMALAIRVLLSDWMQLLSSTTLRYMLPINESRSTLLRRRHSLDQLEEGTH